MLLDNRTQLLTETIAAVLTFTVTMEVKEISFCNMH